MSRSLILLFLLLACSQPSEKSRTLIIGFSQCTTGDDWRQTMNDEMSREIGFYPNYDIELIIRDAHNQSEQQIEDIKYLVSQGIDILIVSPNEAEPLTGIVEEVYSQGIPVMVIDRMINSDKYTAFLGGKNFDIGLGAAHFAAQLLEGRGRVLEITGLPGSTPAMERGKGFREGLINYPGIEIVNSLNGSWLHDRARVLTNDLFFENKNFDLIFAYNDPMAFGAYLSAQKHHINPYIIGVDGLNTPNGGINMVLDGYIDGTFLYPTGGSKAIELAINAYEGKPFSKVNYLATIRLDVNNAQTLKIQVDQINQQQARIDKQRKELGELTFLLDKQHTVSFLLMIISGLMVVIAVMTFYYLQKKSKANRLLNIKNITINKQTVRIKEQRDQLLRVLRIAEEAAETKTRFFTNLSHDFRNALSLIIHPINELVSEKSSIAVNHRLKILQSNVLKLSKLSDEILSFEKIEKNKYYLHFRTSDLGKFLQEVSDSFRPEIESKNLTFVTNIAQPLEACFDLGALEKVMANLLSNAIKYNVEGGKIFLETKKIGNYITVSVLDTGKGIRKKDIKFIFDRFYRADHLSKIDDEPSSGLGLAICKELIQLHQGHIGVTSKYQEGSTFYFTIPQSFDMAPTKSADDIVGKEKLLELKNPSEQTKVLVVEDNREILSVISVMLRKFYIVFEADNGEEGLALAIQHRPDVVISDIYMPSMDGIELCQHIKSTPATFHIPVILLTALDSVDSKIRGFDIGADAYLTKPFNEAILISQIKNLVKSRKKLKEEYKDFDFIGGVKSKEKKENDFIQTCLRKIHEKGSEANFNLDHLASDMNMSRSSLYRRIREITGMKAVDFMRKGKLHYAAKLLLTTDLNVNEVAFECGFNDTKYFSRCFAKEYGNLPSEFKKLV